ncbi:MAG: hypothetical protein IH576_01960 [Deltaproteobacteria bacterium]|nr:hypothetical protein [Deltaproteobacteria bacterium]
MLLNIGNFVPICSEECAGRYLEVRKIIACVINGCSPERGGFEPIRGEEH